MTVWFDYGEDLRKVTREFLLDMGVWPMLMLPLKRNSGSGGWPETGVVYSVNGGEVVVHLHTVFDVPTEATPKVTYADADACIADGWVVD